MALHAITEKPAGVYTAAVREMNEAAKKSEKLFGIMYNQRTNPVYAKVKELLASGEMEQIKRVVWLITNWYRSQSYYNSGGWRATWEGEGGGVLLNQCPHNLDLLQWIAGMPCGVRAFMKYGCHRDIEVENDVTAYLEYPNGATGLSVTSTHETPGTNRLEISGDRGKIVVENNKITFFRTRIGETEFNQTWTGGFGSPEYWQIPIEPAEKAPALTEHMGIFAGFAFCDFSTERRSWRRVKKVFWGYPSPMPCICPIGPAKWLTPCISGTRHCSNNCWMNESPLLRCIKKM